MFARRHGRTCVVFAPAKVNLGLRVLGRRDDGFHQLETLMVAVRLYDRLQWTAARRFSFALHETCAVSDQVGVPCDHRNLVVRALRLLAESAGISPSGRVELWKAIPTASGLGGGSSDAAAALAMGNAAWNLNFPKQRLLDLAAQVGSDVPFFLAGGPAVCTGRGEMVLPVQGLPQLDLVVVKPAEGMSTPKAFAELDAPPWHGSQQPPAASQLASLIEELRSGAISRAAQSFKNDLQAIARRCVESIDRVLDALARLDVCGAVMSGSGSACFAVCRSKRHARSVAGCLSARSLGRVWATSTCH